MVDEDKIIEDQKLLTQRATSLFIQGNTKYNEPPQLYDLDKEFAATKKNKNLDIIISLLVFIAVFILAAIGVTKYISYKNSLIPISINAFEDVNLREIFDKAKQYENQMADALRNREDLYRKKEASTIKITEESENLIIIIEEDNLSDKSNRIRIAKIDLEEKLKIDQEFWETQIKLLDDKIKSIQENIDSYDTKIVEKAKEQEEIINNQQKRFDMELAKSVEYYENKIKELNNSYTKQIDDINQNNNKMINTIKGKNNILVDSLEDKYNPKFNNEFNFLNSSLNEIAPFEFNGKLNELLFSEGLLDKKEIQDKINSIYTTEKVFNRIKEIPYYNSPSKALLYLENSYHLSIQELWDLLNNIPPLLKEKNNLILSQKNLLEELNYFIDSYVSTNRINGIIIDPRSKNIKIYMNTIFNIKDGDIGYIYRNDSDYIGTITFRYNNGDLHGEIEKLINPARNLEPFDMILINLK